MPRRTLWLARLAATTLLATSLAVGGFARLTEPARAASVTVGVDPPTKSADAGEAFDLAITITSDVPTRGVQFGLTYDPSVVQATKVTEGNFYKGWAKSNGASSAVAIPFKPDNQNGKISAGGIALLGGDPHAGPTGSGTLVTISFTSKPGTSAGSPISINNFILSDANAQTITDATLSGGKVLIGGVDPASVAAGVAQAAPTVPATATLVFPGQPTAPAAATPPVPTQAPAPAPSPKAPVAPTSPNVQAAATSPTAGTSARASPSASGPAAAATKSPPPPTPTPPAAANPTPPPADTSTPPAGSGIPTAVPVIVPSGSPGILIPWEALGGFGGGLAAVALVLYALRRSGE